MSNKWLIRSTHTIYVSLDTYVKVTLWFKSINQIGYYLQKKYIIASNIYDMVVKEVYVKLGVMCYSAERKSIPVVINFSIDVEAYRSSLFMASFKFWSSLLAKALPKKKWHIFLPFFAIHPPCTPKECAGPSEDQKDRNKNSSRGGSWVLLRKTRDPSG